MGNSKSTSSGGSSSRVKQTKGQRRLQRSVQKSQRHHESKGSAPVFVESGEVGTSSVRSVGSKARRHSRKDRSPVPPTETVESSSDKKRMTKGDSPKGVAKGDGKGASKEGAKGKMEKLEKVVKTEKVSTPKPCVAMSFQLMSNLPSTDMDMIKDAASYSTSSYVSLTDSFEDNSFSDEEILYPLSRHFQDVAKEGYGEAVFFKHVPEPRISSKDMNMDVFRGIKKSQASKQENAQLRKIKVAKEAAEKGGEKEEGAKEEESKQYELKIKGFAKSLPKVIEGGTIVSTPGWREALAKRKAEKPSSQSRSKSTPRIGYRSNKDSFLSDKKMSNSFDTGVTSVTTERTHESRSSRYYKKRTAGNTLNAVLDMLNCIDVANHVKKAKSPVNVCSNPMQQTAVEGN